MNMIPDDTRWNILNCTIYTRRCNDLLNFNVHEIDLTASMFCFFTLNKIHIRIILTTVIEVIINMIKKFFQFFHSSYIFPERNILVVVHFEQS